MYDINGPRPRAITLAHSLLWQCAKLSFGGEPVRAELTDLLARMQPGDVIDRSAEYKHLDLKEEA